MQFPMQFSVYSRCFVTEFTNIFDFVIEDFLQGFWTFEDTDLCSCNIPDS